MLALYVSIISPAWVAGSKDLNGRKCPGSKYAACIYPQLICKEIIKP